jgi:hypothetical protein
VAPSPLRTALHSRRLRLALFGATLAAGLAFGVAASVAPSSPKPVVLAAEDGAPELDPPLGIEGFVVLEKRLAEERQARAQAMLDRLWPGRAFVTVGVELDPRWTRSAERIQPESPAIREDERPEGASPGSRRRAYEPFSGERETRLLAPELRRVSAALVLDTAIARDQQQQLRIVEAVKKAIGPVRGQDPDVEVLVESFAAPPAAKPVRRTVVVADPTADFAVFGASIAIAAMGMAWFWYRRARRRRRAALAAEQTVEPAAPTAEGARARRTAIEDAIAGDPVFASRLVESWMAEGRT